MPDLPTTGPYGIENSHLYLPKKKRYGFFERDQSLFFYQIDYFGDLFVLEWNGFGLSEWTQFTVKGDQFTVTLLSYSRDNAYCTQPN